MHAVSMHNGTAELRLQAPDIAGGANSVPLANLLPPSFLRVGGLDLQRVLGLVHVGGIRLENTIEVPSSRQREREREGAEPLSRKLQGDTNRRPANCGCALAHGGSDLDAVATPKPCRERERERECKIPLYNLDSYEQPGGQSLSQSTHNTQASFVHQAVVQS